MNNYILIAVFILTITFILIKIYNSIFRILSNNEVKESFSILDITKQIKGLENKLKVVRKKVTDKKKSFQKISSTLKNEIDTLSTAHKLQSEDLKQKRKEYFNNKSIRGKKRIILSNFQKRIANNSKYKRLNNINIHKFKKRLRKVIRDYKKLNTMYNNKRSSTQVTEIHKVVD